MEDNFIMRPIQDISNEASISRVCRGPIWWHTHLGGSLCFSETKGKLQKTLPDPALSVQKATRLSGTAFVRRADPQGYIFMLGLAV